MNLFLPIILMLNAASGASKVENGAKFVKVGTLQNSASTWAMVINLDTRLVVEQLREVDELLNSVTMHMKKAHGEDAGSNPREDKPEWMILLNTRIETALAQFISESQHLSNRTESFVGILQPHTKLRNRRAVKGNKDKSPWTLFNIAPYHELTTLANEVNQLELKEVMLNQTLEEQKLLLRDVYSVAESNYAHLQTLPWDRSEPGAPSRKERSVFPGLGVAMNKLIGTATQGQIDDITHSLKLLEESEEQLQIIQSKALIALNATHIRTQLNEENIRKLSDRILEFKKLLSKMELRYKIFDERTNNALAQVIQVEQFISDLASKLDDINLQFNELVVAFQSVLAGELSPSLLPPDQFSRALHTVEEALPEGVALIKKPLGNLYYYYKNTPVFVWPDKESFVIIAMVNLRSFRSEYDIYEFTGLPIILPNSSLYIQTESDAPFLALSKDELSWYLPSENSIRPCLDNIDLVCVSQEPQFSIDSQSHCLIALYMKNHEAIPRLCTRKIRQVDPSIPLITSLGKGRWIISPFQAFRFTIQCLGTMPGSNTIKKIWVRQPLELQLSNGCHAYSSTFSLPRYFVRSISIIRSPVTWSYVNVTVPSEIYNNVLNASIDNGLNNALKDQFKLLPMPVDAVGESLKQVANNLNINQRLLQLSKHNIANIKVHQASSWHKYGIMGLAIVMVILAVIIWYNCRNKVKCAKRLSFRRRSSQENPYAHVEIPMQSVPPPKPMYPDLKPVESTKVCMCISRGAQASAPEFDEQCEEACEKSALNNDASV